MPAIVDELQPGQLVSYGWVASGEAGKPRAARAVGNVLGELCDDVRPWWRVVQANGQIVSPRRGEQRARLLEDGAVLDGDRVLDPRFSAPDPTPARSLKTVFLCYLRRLDAHRITQEPIVMGGRSGPGCCRLPRVRACRQRGQQATTRGVRVHHHPFRCERRVLDEGGVIQARAGASVTPAWACTWALLRPARAMRSAWPRRAASTNWRSRPRLVASRCGRWASSRTPPANSGR